jgi:hypothetical protein
MGKHVRRRQFQRNGDSFVELLYRIKVILSTIIAPALINTLRLRFLTKSLAFKADSLKQRQRLKITLS